MLSRRGPMESSPVGAPVISSSALTYAFACCGSWSKDATPPVGVFHPGKVSYTGLTRATSDALAGKTVVISGNFSISREAMKGLIEAHGGKNAGSVSGKTSWLLAGEKAGPEKLKKAEKLGIPVIDETRFYQLVGKKEE